MSSAPENKSSKGQSIAFRLIGAAGLWVAVMLIVGGLLLSNLFRGPLEQSFDQRMEFLLESLIGAVEVGHNRELFQRQSLGEPRFLRQYSGWYWQITRIDNGDVIARSRSMWDFELAISEDTKTGALLKSRARGPLGQRLQLIEKPITVDGMDGTYLFSVAADRQDLVDTIDSFNVTLGWSLGVLWAGLVLAVFIQVRFGLLPLQRIRQSLADIREGRSERLTGSFPKEVSPLAEELNGLLDHTTEVLGRARSHVGNLAHALKTPLAVLSNESETPTENISTIVDEQTQLMRRHVDHHLARARAMGQAPLLRGQTPLLPVLEAVARTLEKIYAHEGVSISVKAPPELAFRGEQHDLEEMLGNLVDNACKWARREVALVAESYSETGSGGLQIQLQIDDDGPGVPEEKREEIFGRGERADESTPGSGLGLSIVRDIATLYGGDVSLGDAPEGGLRATLILPGGLIPADAV
ncbi:MAG: ATP-binding protein [Rhodospirillaceae bacterium]|nr:ATP-binding protein [Rhodospirillaceae bacterium]